MDDYIFVGARSELDELSDSMSYTLLLRDITFLTRVGDAVQFLGLDIAKAAGGFTLSVSQALLKEIVQDAGVDKSTRVAAVPGSRERVVDDTPLDAEGHRYYRVQVERLLYIVSLRADLQFTVGQLS